MNIEILRLFGARNKRHRSHLQRKLNVSFDACSSLTTFVPLLTPAQNDDFVNAINTNTFTPGQISANLPIWEVGSNLQMSHYILVITPMNIRQIAISIIYHQFIF